MESKLDDQIEEAALAVSLLKSSSDLDERMQALLDRGRVATFVVTVPEGYSDRDMDVFKRSVMETLDGIAKEAHEQVKFERTWGKLGDDE